MKHVFALMVVAALIFLSGCQCCGSPRSFSDYCQKDYWGDTQYDIFGRKNCIGDTGRWIDQNNGHDGYFCTSPWCTTYDRINCKDTCCKY